MSKKRKTFSAEFKSKVVLELLSSDMSISQIASKYEVTAKSIADWKKQFLSNASLVTTKRDWAVGKLSNYWL